MTHLDEAALNQVLNRLVDPWHKKFAKDVIEAYLQASAPAGDCAIELRKICDALESVDTLWADEIVAANASPDLHARVTGDEVAAAFTVKQLIVAVDTLILQINQRQPTKAQPAAEVVNLNKCPKCGGPADNGHDRCLPPSPYYCTKCSCFQAAMPEAPRGTDDWIMDAVKQIAAIKPDGTGLLATARALGKATGIAQGVIEAAQIETRSAALTADAVPVDAVRERYRAIAHFLYNLLDDIDTADDMAKTDDALYRGLVRQAHAKRHIVADCDGYTVSFKDNLKIPTAPTIGAPENLGER